MLPTRLARSLSALAGALCLLGVLAPASASAVSPEALERLNALPADLNLPELKPGRFEPVDPTGRRANVTIFADDFEGAAMNPGWAVGIASGAADAAWGLTNVTAGGGAQSAFCAAVGSQAVAPGVDVYPDNMNTFMVHGPFSLADATASGMNVGFYCNTEASFDFVQFLVSVDGFTTFDGYQFSGRPSSNWTLYGVDFATLPVYGNINGAPSVSVAIRFISDSSFGLEGAFVDDVAVLKVTDDASPTPTPSPSPSPSPTPGPTASPSATPTPSPTPPQGTITKSFTIFNDGTAPLNVSSLTKQNNSSWLSFFPVGPLTIQPGSSRVVDVTVNPAGLSPGVYTDRIVIGSNDPDENPYPNAVNITYTVGGGATPTPTPTPVGANNVGVVLGQPGAVGADLNGDLVIDVADIVFP
jgi:hypothetical protein